MSKKNSNYLVLTHLYDHIVIGREKLAHWEKEELDQTGQLCITMLRRTEDKDGNVVLKNIHHSYLFLPYNDHKNELKEKYNFDFESYIKGRAQAIDAMCHHFNSEKRKRSEALAFYEKQCETLNQIFDELDDINIVW